MELCALDALEICCYGVKLVILQCFVSPGRETYDSDDAYSANYVKSLCRLFAGIILLMKEKLY